MRFIVEETIAAPIDEVFAYMANFNNDPEWKAYCLSSETISGDGRQGTCFEYVAKAFGRTQRRPAVVTEFEQNAYIAFRVTDEEGGVSGWRRFARAPGGTRVTVGFEVDLPRLMGTWSKVPRFLAVRMARADLHTVKKMIERTAAAA